MNIALIREVMEEREITTKQLAEDSAIPKSTLERILSGSTPNPTMQTAADIAVALNLSLDDIAGIEHPHEDVPAQQRVQHFHSSSAEVTMLYRAMLRDKERWIKRLSIAVVVLVLYQMFRWLLDVSNPNVGWIRVASANANGALIFLLIAFIVAFVALLKFVLPFFLRGKSAKNKTENSEG